MARPINQGTFKTDITASLLRFNPLVAEDFFPLSEELSVKGRAARKVGISLQLGRHFSHS